MRKTILIFHIGSASVSGSLILKEAGVWEVLFSKTENFFFQEEVTAETLFSETTKAMNSFLKDLSKKHLPIPEEVFCELASPWYFSEIRKIQFKKNTNFSFNSKLANNLLEKEALLFKKERLGEDPLSLKEEIEPFETKILKTVLNGYETPHPFGQKIKELEMEVFVSLGTKEVFDKLKQIIHSYFPLKKICFSSQVLQAFLPARDIFPEKDFFLFFVGGEITDISVVKDGSLIGLHSFPLGSNSLIRKVGEILQIPFWEAETNLKLFTSGHLENLAEKKIIFALEDFKNLWLAQLEGFLKDFSASLSFPHLVFLTSEKDFEKIFQSLIKAERYHQHLFTEKKFKVTSLPKEALENLSINRFVC